MGGCVAGCMAAQNEKTQEPNKHIKEVRGMNTQSVDYGKPEKEGEGPPRHSWESASTTLEAMYKEAYGGEDKTLARTLREACKKHADKNAVAYRPLDKYEQGEIEVDEKKKPWEYIHLKETQYITYAQFWDKVVAFGRGLASLGFTSGARIGLYEETRYEWLVGCYGLWSQSMVGTTVYANLGEDALIYAIREAELAAMICNAKAIKKLISLCRSSGVPVPMLIYNDELPAEIAPGGAEHQAVLEGVTIVSFEEVLSKGVAGEEPSLPENPDDLALIMYTSGTTGDPKGVLITHGNAMAALKGAAARVTEYLNPEGGDVHVAYLPLAHILEFTVENILLSRGCMLAYGNPRTLTDTSAKPHGDLKEYKPNFFVGVPRIFDTIKKAVQAKLPQSGVKRAVFDRAYKERKEALEKGYDTPYWNEKAFGTTRALLGGRCKMLISGGAPLSGATQEFLSVVFGCAVAQGYGLTETCAAGTIQRYYDLQKDNIGGILDVLEAKLVDVDEFKHTDPQPRGEICIRGPPVAKGYYKQPEKTKEAFMDDGWFHTGDVGTFCKDGTLKIIGRVKALAKNLHGEYIAMESLESTYVLNDLVMPNGVCVLVNPQRAYITALVLTDESKANKFAKANNIQGKFPEFLETEEFQKKATESLAATAKEAGRNRFELVQNVRVLAEEWTPENGVLTAAMKLKRRIVDEKYKETIEKLFEKE